MCAMMRQIRVSQPKRGTCEAGDVRIRIRTSATYLLKLVFLALLVLAGLGCLPVQLLRSELWSAGMRQYAPRVGGGMRRGRGSTFKLKRAFSRPDMMSRLCERFRVSDGEIFAGGECRMLRFRGHWQPRLGDVEGATAAGKTRLC